MQIRTVGVLGCGLMGSGIAQVSAAAGYKTIVGDLNKKMLERGQARIRKFLEDGIAKGRSRRSSRDDDARQPDRDHRVRSDEGLRPDHRGDHREHRRQGQRLQACSRRR